VAQSVSPEFKPQYSKKKKKKKSTLETVTVAVVVLANISLIYGKSGGEKLTLGIWD
jgi:hypothetical protein